MLASETGNTASNRPDETSSRSHASYRPVSSHGSGAATSTRTHLLRLRRWTKMMRRHRHDDVVAGAAHRASGRQAGELVSVGDERPRHRVAGAVVVIVTLVSAGATS